MSTATASRKNCSSCRFHIRSGAIAITAATWASAPFAGSDARLGRWVGGPYTNFGEPDEQAQAAVDDAMGSATAGMNDVWVLFSEAEMWDSRAGSWTNGWIDTGAWSNRRPSPAWKRGAMH